MENGQKKFSGDKKIGQYVKELREKRNMSQKELAEKVAISQSVIARLGFQIMGVAL